MRSRPIGATVRGMQSASRRLTLLIDEEPGPLHCRVALSACGQRELVDGGVCSVPEGRRAMTRQGPLNSRDAPTYRRLLP